MDEPQNINDEIPEAAQAVEDEEDTTQAVQLAEEEEEDGELDEGESEEEQEEFEEEAISGQQTIVLTRKEPAKPKEPKREITLKPTREQIEGWNKAIKVMQALEMDEATFNYNGNLLVDVINQSRTSMVSATIDMGLGISSLITETPAVTRKFTCNLMELKRALRMDSPKIAVGQDEMVFSNSKTQLKISLVDDDDETEVPKPKLPAGTTIDVNFDEVFKDLTKYLGSDNIPDKLLIDVVSGKANVSGTNDNGQTIEIRDYKATGADAKGEFSSNMLRALRDSSWNAEWNISFSTGMPIVATTTIKHTDYQPKTRVEMTDAHVTVYLAPRITQYE